MVEGGSGVVGSIFVAGRGDGAHSPNLRLEILKNKMHILGHVGYHLGCSPLAGSGSGAKDRTGREETERMRERPLNCKTQYKFVSSQTQEEAFVL